MMASEGKIKATVYLDRFALQTLATAPDTPDMNRALIEYARLIADTTRALAERIEENDWVFLAWALAPVLERALQPGETWVDVVRWCCEDLLHDDVQISNAYQGATDRAPVFVWKLLEKLTESEALAALVASRYYWHLLQKGAIPGPQWWEPMHRFRQPGPPIRKGVLKDSLAGMRRTTKA